MLFDSTADDDEQPASFSTEAMIIVDLRMLVFVLFRTAVTLSDIIRLRLIGCFAETRLARGSSSESLLLLLVYTVPPCSSLLIAVWRVSVESRSAKRVLRSAAHCSVSARFLSIGPKLP